MRFQDLSVILFSNEFDLLKFFSTDSFWQDMGVEDIEYILDVEFPYSNGIFLSDIENDPNQEDLIEETQNESIDYYSYRKREPKNSDVLGLPKQYPVILLYEYIDDTLVGKYIYYKNIVETRLAHKAMTKEE